MEVAIITAAAGPARRGRALGLQGAAQALGLSLGPALGGLLIQSLGWRWVFWINVPAGLVGALLGWAVLPQTPLSGRLSETLGPRPLTVTGMVLVMVALLALAALLTGQGATLPLVIVALLVFGLGQGLFTAPNNSAIMGAAPPDQLGVAGGILNVTRTLGTSLGVAVATVLFAERLARLAGHAISTAQAPRAAVLTGVRETLLVFALVALVAAGISLVRGHVASPIGSMPEGGI